MASTQDRASATDTEVCALLKAGKSRAAYQEARSTFEAELADLFRSDPARAELLAAATAGSMVASSATLATQQPPPIPGYTGGRPATEHLIAAYEAGRGGAR